jgi:hypothetical protein
LINLKRDIVFPILILAILYVHLRINENSTRAYIDIFVIFMLQQALSLISSDQESTLPVNIAFLTSRTLTTPIQMIIHRIIENF